MAICDGSASLPVFAPIAARDLMYLICVWLTFLISVSACVFSSLVHSCRSLHHDHASGERSLLLYWKF
jgi:hypothetical protein